MRRPDPARPYIRAFYERNRGFFLLALALYALCQAGTLYLAWLLGTVLDTIAAGRMEPLAQSAWRALVFIPAMIALELCWHRARAAFLRRALTQYKALAFQKLSEKSISAFTQENTGRYLSVLTNDISTVEEKYLVQQFDLLIQPMAFAATLALLLWYSPVLTAATAALCLLPFAAAALLGPGLARREKAVSDRGEGFVSKLRDLLAGFSVIKSFKAEGETSRVFAKENDALERAKAGRRWWVGILNTVSGYAGAAMQFGVFFLSAFLAIRGDVTAGTVIVFTQLSNNLLTSVRIIPQYWADRKAARGLIEKLAAIAEENAARSGEAIQPQLTDAIALDRVSFGYEPDKPVLRDVSLRLEAGKKYALVGVSGSGKSTLLNLLMGGCDGYTGSLTVDGKELRAVDPDSLYDLMSLIGQNVFVFDDTIRRNITMFRGFPAEAVDSAADRAGLSALMEERGPDYRCGENGAGLSGGERQRVSIARALLRGTPVLLLDEATASLDNETAFAVTQAILDLEGLTQLIVTHRLDRALLAQYDEIFVLRDGRLIERGGFDALMGQKGYFYSLYTISGT